MENLETTDPQTQADPSPQTDQSKDTSVDTDASVDKSAADSESLLGQDPTEEVKEESDDFNNPLTDDSEEKQEGEEKEKNNVDFEKIELPEGFEMDETFKPLVSDLNLSQEQVQKLVDYKSEADKLAADKSKADFNEVVKNLQKETKEMLGTDYKKELSYAAKAMNLISKEDQAELKQVLAVSGMGNHPMLVKMFVAVGKSLSESKFVDGNTGVKSEKTDPALALGRNLIKK